MIYTLVTWFDCIEPPTALKKATCKASSVSGHSSNSSKARARFEPQATTPAAHLRPLDLHTFCHFRSPMIKRDNLSSIPASWSVSMFSSLMSSLCGFFVVKLTKEMILQRRVCQQGTCQASVSPSSQPLFLPLLTVFLSSNEKTNKWGMDASLNRGFACG